MENNNLNELEQLKAQYETLKQQFDQQEIVNKRLMKSAIQTNVDFFERNRKVAMFVYPIIAVLMYIYLEVMGFRTSAIILVILMAIATFVELWLTRNTRRHVVENSDLLTLSKNMQKLKIGYSIYVVIWLFVCFVLGAGFTLNHIFNQELHGPDFVRAIWVLGFMGMLLLVFGIVAYRTFVGHCNSIIRQIDAIEGKSSSNKNMTFWYFLSSLTVLIVGGLIVSYHLGKPKVYERAANDMYAEGKLEIRDLDADTIVFDNAGKPIVSKLDLVYKSKGDSKIIMAYMTPDGRQAWKQFTTKAKGHNVALYMDGTIVSYYFIKDVVDNGCFFIMANPDWSEEELDKFCNRLIKN